jgi:hypothetical protein
LIDWSDGAGIIYARASYNTKVTGTKIADFILKSNINPMTVHCIGFSLGSHVCGFVGKKVKLARITGKYKDTIKLV